MADALLIEPCDFEEFPPGGQLSFARQMVRVLGPRLALVGISTDDAPVGRWVQRRFHGLVCDFFSVGRWTKSPGKPLLPRRLRAYCDIRRYRREILAANIRNVFIQAPEVLLAVHRWGWENMCFYFPGLTNPLQISRYGWAQPLAGAFHSVFTSALRSADRLLAAADQPSIDAFAVQTRGKIRKENIISFPTRVDTDVFRRAGQAETRASLGLPRGVPIYATVARLHWAKGWELLVDAFQVLLRRIPEAYLCFVGDGEDRHRIEARLRAGRLMDRVRITGYLEPRAVAAYLNAADVFVLASYREGWPTAAVEALATGKPIVSTPVSAARSLIEVGKNGFIVPSRDPHAFSESLAAALSLPEACACSAAKAQRYALTGLAEELGRLWLPLRG